VVLPSADVAGAWFVEAARAAVHAGERLDARAVQLLIALSPGDPAIASAIETLIVEPATLAGYAREATARLRDAVAAGDEAAARETVTALETEVLRAYRPSRGLERVEDDIAVAFALLAAYDIGADQTHLMMAEELLLGFLRREWDQRAELDLAISSDAAVALAALAERTEKPEYRERALEVMVAFATSYRDHGVRAAPYVSALRLLRPE
jgi:uncharacterized protein YyaL (SSP411 family)